MQVTSRKRSARSYREKAHDVGEFLSIGIDPSFQHQDTRGMTVQFEMDGNSFTMRLDNADLLRLLEEVKKSGLIK